jgi:hypothetical protein
LAVHQAVLFENIILERAGGGIMKRDLDTVREILREISDAPGKPDQGVLVKGKSPEETQKILTMWHC